MLGQRGVLIGLIAFCGILSSGAENIDDPEERLLDYLFTNSSYNKDVRPGIIKNGTKGPLNVSVTFGLYRLLDLDGQKESMSVLLFVQEEWLDPRLTWNPKDFGGKTMLKVKAGTVWTPRSYILNLEILNREDKVDELNAQISIEDENSTAAEVTLIAYATMQERCDFDMTYFPFDTQKCRMCTVATQYTIDELVYDTTYTSANSFVGGGEWDLVGVTVSNGAFGNASMACIEVTVQRRSLYYVINLFLPTVTICILNTVGLFASIDPDQTQLDLASLGQTTLLSLGVLMLTVADQTPKGVSEVSLLGVFFLAMIFQTLLAALTAMYLIKWHRRKKLSEFHKFRPQLRPQLAFAIENVRDSGFQTEQASRVCMILNLIIIVLITLATIAAGYFNKPKILG